MSINKILDREHQQSFNTCLLSSYSVAANYFTNEPILNYFEAYMKQFNQSYTSIDIYERQAEHIKTQLDQISGFNFIVQLHDNSEQDIFTRARRKFKAEKIQIQNGTIGSGTKNGDSLLNILSETNSMLNLFINFKDKKFPSELMSMHSILVYCWNNKIYYHDTNFPTREFEIENKFYEYEGLGDTILYSELS